MAKIFEFSLLSTSLMVEIFKFSLMNMHASKSELAFLKSISFSKSKANLFKHLSIDSLISALNDLIKSLAAANGIPIEHQFSSQNYSLQT